MGAWIVKVMHYTRSIDLAERAFAWSCIDYCEKTPVEQLSGLDSGMSGLPSIHYLHIHYLHIKRYMAMLDS